MPAHFDLTADDSYQSLLGKISEVYATGQTRAAQAVNTHITETYWQIGRDIVEFEQGGKTRAEYGTGLLASLSRDLTLRHGKGFSRSNVTRFRQFYLAYPKCAKASHILSWSHYVELLKLEDPLERSFYEQQSIHENGPFPSFNGKRSPPSSFASPPEKKRTPSSSSPPRGKSLPSPPISCVTPTSSSS
ncbi:MAG: DUF1016 N-terminal domain-containing protein [Roseimicrobium sp.]